MSMRLHHNDSRDVFGYFKAVFGSWVCGWKEKDKESNNLFSGFPITLMVVFLVHDLVEGRITL